MNKSKTDKSNELTIKNGNLIASHRRSLLADVDVNNTNKLWSAVNKAKNPKTKSAQLYDKIGDTVDFNKLFANIATDSAYSKSDIAK